VHRPSREGVEVHLYKRPSSPALSEFHSPSSVAQYPTPVVHVAGILAITPLPTPLVPVNASSYHANISVSLTGTTLLGGFNTAQLKSPPPLFE